MAELTLEQQWDFENDKLDYIADMIKDGYYSGITPYGTSWSLDVDFDYDGAWEELGLNEEDE